MEESCFQDDDQDGFCQAATGRQQEDCDDYDPALNPGATEVCNGVDDDCDGEIDEDTQSQCALSCEEPSGGCDVPVAIVAGQRHACALSETGRVLCWGSNAQGGLGSPNLNNATLPLPVPGVAGATALVTSGTVTCALTAAEVVCWGGKSAYPFAISVPETTAQIAVSNGSLLMLDDSGSVRRRALFPGMDASAEPVELWMGAVAVAAAADTACAITMGGALECTGSVDGIGMLAPSGVSDVKVMLDGSICFKAEGELKCAGSVDLAPDTVAGNGSAVGYARGALYACAFNDTGKLACWSDQGPTGISDATGLAIGTEFGCVLRSDGKISCWGSRNNGALGDGVAGPGAEPEPVDTKPAPIVGLPEVVLLRETPLGSCDSLADVGLLGGGSNSGGRLHASLLACQGECESRLDVAECYSACATNPGLSAACFDCFLGLAACSGADCYAAFNSCAGYAVDFLEPHRNAPRFECQGAQCLKGAPLGTICADDSECMSGLCDALAQLRDTTVCAASSGTPCSRDASKCNCQLGQDVFGETTPNGHCGGCYDEGRVGSAAGDCFRECTTASYCELGQDCNYFSRGNERYCE